MEESMGDMGEKREKREKREKVDYNIDNRDNSIEDQLRREARRRTTNYEHPHIELTHQPINAPECQEMQQQLRELVA